MILIVVICLTVLTDITINKITILFNTILSMDITLNIYINKLIDL